jgi:hypothetical protein
LWSKKPSVFLLCSAKQSVLFLWIAPPGQSPFCRGFASAKCGLLHREQMHRMERELQIHSKKTWM